MFVPVSCLYTVSACLKKKVCLSFCPADSVASLGASAVSLSSPPLPIPFGFFFSCCFPPKGRLEGKSNQVGRGLRRWRGDSTPALSTA